MKLDLTGLGRTDDLFARHLFEAWDAPANDGVEHLCLAMVALARRVEALRPKPDDLVTPALDHAEGAFWNSVAEAYPYVVSGDFPPDASAKLRAAMREAIEEWRRINLGAKK